MTTDTETPKPLGERKERIATDFTRVARGYDLLCALNPGYIRHLGMSANRLKLAGDASVLDLCCGTGLSTAALRKSYPGVSITGLDASAGMLAVARNKKNLSDVTWIEGDGMNPAAAGATGPYDGILMAYGIRNMVDPDLCLTRLHELLKPGGSLCLHEYSVADSRRSQWTWKLVTSTIVIPLGLVFTGTTSIYRYLRESVLEFDGVAALEERLKRAGFIDVRTEPMDGWQRGIVHSFLARRAEQ
ncbi:MAG: class I SAM-dependent methyltransferase [Candidatus Latescibacterota bacterium]|nr:MAG: class I SAM-dependent methyltransferase [Candidatus Latescibacterota bacterium]